MDFMNEWAHVPLSLAHTPNKKAVKMQNLKIHTQFTIQNGLVLKQQINKWKDDGYYRSLSCTTVEFFAMVLWQFITLFF